MKNLKNIILERLDDESLSELGEIYPSLNVDLEWARRLNTCDSKNYLSTLYFLSENKIKKSNIINRALYNLRNCFPWKIGVIYDFQYGQIKSVDIRIGENFGRYKYRGRKMIFGHSDANISKKMLREIISSNSNTGLFSTTLDKNLSNQVRDLILNNQTLSVDIAIKRELTQTYPGYQPVGENFIAQPFSISSNLQKIQLIPDIEASNIVTVNKVPISFSDEVKTYISAITY